MTRRVWPTLLSVGGLLALALIWLGSTQAAQGAFPVRAYFPEVRNDRLISTPTPTFTSTPSPTPTIPPSLYAHGKPGYDLSFPQCGVTTIPSIASNGAPYTFAVVGVSDGKAFTKNPCLASEEAFVSGQGLLVSFYLNINAPIGPTASNGNTGPRGSCAPGDNICLSYNYGYNAAQSAYNWATSQVGSAGVAGRAWWLDVETANSWFVDANANDQAIQGAIDYLRQQGAIAGVYSIPSMWSYASTAGPSSDGSVPIASLGLWPMIAGSGYRPSAPSWTSGAATLASAPSFCSSGGFTGGPTWLVQEPNYTAPSGANYDEDYAC